MSTLLINESPLQVLPSLAKAVGLNEAIILQQIHYWCERSPHEHQGITWFYRTDDELLAEFSFWSKSTLRRAVKRLEELNLIRVEMLHGKLMGQKYDRTKWYSVDYSELGKIERQPSKSACSQNDQMHVPEVTDACGQSEQMACSQNDQMGCSQNDQMVIETTTEITTENTTGAADAAPDEFLAVILKDGSEYPLTDVYRDELAQSYPTIDVPQELRSLCAWAKANPTKRKTRAGVNRFVVSWLQRCLQIQTEKPNGSGPSPAAQKRSAISESVMNINDTSW